MNFHYNKVEKINELLIKTLFIVGLLIRIKGYRENYNLTLFTSNIKYSSKHVLNIDEMSKTQTIDDPTVLCPTCRKIVDDDDDALACDVCDVWFHYSCLKNPLKLSFERLSKKPQWYCENCKTDQLNANQLVKSTNSILVELKGAIAELKLDNSSVAASILELTKNLEFQINKHDDLRTDVVHIKNDVDNLKNHTLLELQDNNKKLSSEIQLIKSELNICNQDKLSTEAICFGVPTTSNENLMQVITSILQFYNVSTHGLSRCRRIHHKRRESSSTTPPVILSFINSQSRNQLMQSTKKLKMYAPSANEHGLFSEVIQQKPVFIREMLTRENKILLDSAKTALSKKVKFVWSTNGKIYARINENDKLVRWIKSPNDIQSILDSIAVSAALGTSNNTSNNIHRFPRGNINNIAALDTSNGIQQSNVPPNGDQHLPAFSSPTGGGSSAAASSG